MINQDVNIEFIHAGNNEKLTVFCERVKFSLELIGHVLEKLDYTLVENYNGKHRQRLEIKCQLDLYESVFMAEFLQATDKKIAIDGLTFEVVNADKQIDFDLFKNYNIKSDLTLNFRVKTVGTVYPSAAGVFDELIIED